MKGYTKAEKALLGAQYDFSEVLCLALEETRMRPGTLAKRSGVPITVIDSIIRGEGDPTIIQMVAIARALKRRLHIFLMPVESDEWVTLRGIQTMTDAAKKPR